MLSPFGTQPVQIRLRATGIPSRLFGIIKREHSDRANVDGLGRACKDLIERITVAIVIARENHNRRVQLGNVLMECRSTCGSIGAIAVIQYVAQDHGEIRFDPAIQTMDGTQQENIRKVAPALRTRARFAEVNVS